MPRVRLHLDADTSRKSLHQALIDRGHDVTRTPNPWIGHDATDEMQLLSATAQGRCIFTFNVKDFVVLSRKHPQHRGILLAAQQSWSLSSLIDALDRFLASNDGESVDGQIVWLNFWRT
jgi:Domain of unknown function (DUF5615)